MGSAATATPLPYRALTAIFLCNITAMFQFGILYPFIPFMVEELRGTTLDMGLYVGVAQSAYMLGSFLASFVWPPLSDKIGRKKVLVLGQLGLSLPFLFFGFSHSYWQMVAARFLNGVLHSNGAVTKAAYADITDSTNRAKAISIHVVVYGFGNMMGPVLGGISPGRYCKVVLIPACIFH